MSAQFAPALSQRRHWEPGGIVGVPVHVPSTAVSVLASVGVPRIVGSDWLTGSVGATTAVCTDVAFAGPATLVAVTTTRIVLPTSVGVSASVLLVAPAMSAQLAPALLQRRHSYVKQIGGVPVQVPSDATLRDWPPRAVPLTVGRTVLKGAEGATTAVCALVA